MSVWRDPGTPCPIDEKALAFPTCRSCPYFRGAYQRDKGWRVNCNWPRNGSDIAREPIPEMFRDAFAGDGGDA